MGKSYLRLYLLGLRIIVTILLLGLPIGIWYGIGYSSWKIDEFIWEKTTPKITELQYLRKNYPEYNDLDDTTLVKKIARKAEKTSHRYKSIDKRFASNNLRLVRESEYSESMWLWVIMIIAIPLCLSLYFPIISIVVRSIKKSIKELKNE